MQYSCKVARMDTHDGCPLEPGASLNRTVVLKPLAQNISGARGTETINQEGPQFFVFFLAGIINITTYLF